MEAGLVARHWGKARPATEGPRWHPLAYHALDVAAAMDALLDGDPQRMAPLVALDAGPPEAVRAGLVIAAALHDLGKHAPGFQAKAPDTPQGSALRGRAISDPGHDRTGWYLWRSSAPRHLGRSGAARRLTAWVAAACCHHGRGRESLPVAPAVWVAEYAGLRPEDEAALDAYVAAALALPEAEGWEGLAPPTSREDEAYVAGLVTQADWLGSKADEGWFTYRAPHLDAADYWPLARERAKEAVFKAGLVVQPRAEPLTIGEAMRADGPVTPTPLQAWASEVALPNEPCLALIEDLTGAGKTEAAALLASRMVAAGRASGVYWAMPTLATANAMYARAAPLAETIYGAEASAALMGSKRHLNEAFSHARAAATAAEAARAIGGTDTTPAEIMCADWVARDARLGFLAPVGAGTLDQALLGLLPARHWPVRLAGLGPRVLIVDEAHAYDAYTGRLLETLLTAHARAGGSAIVLSATLTSSLHGRLVAAFRCGRGADAPPPEPLPLPCAALMTGAGDASASFAGQDGRGTRRDTPVVRLDDVPDAVRVLTEAAARGAACLWVRNTVDDAREGREMLAEAGCAAALFHSRLTAGDRRRAESALLSHFGKGGTDRAGVVVATQVAEQSLDLDFDVMVSDLAPYDSLIQRAGRLHRHAGRTRPEGYEEAVLHVVTPPTEGARSGWYEAAFPRAAYVYRAHGRLWRGARRIEHDGGLPLASRPPRDLLDWVYEEDDGTPPPLAEADMRIEEGEDCGRAGAASMAVIDRAAGYVGEFGQEERAVTRLGDPTRPVLLAKADGDEIVPWEEGASGWRAWALSEVGVPERLFGEGMVPEALQEAVTAITRERPWETVWVLDPTGQGRVQRGEEVVAVKYSADCGLVFTTA